MTGELDAELGPIDVELIAEFGKSITLARVAAAAYDPATASSAQTSTSETINALIEEYKGYDFANGLAVAGDKKITVAALGLTKPNLGDKITVDGVIFNIEKIESVYSGELECIYIIQARK